VFRSAAWVQAWIDTWGKHQALQLIDLGGRSNPLEQVYITRQRLKKIVPVNSLCLAGVGCNAISTPRSEYNNISDLVRCLGGVDTLFSAISALPWQQFLLPDVLKSSEAEQNVNDMCEQAYICLHPEKIEPAYSVQSPSFEMYLQHLGANTRLAYFNRRKNLAQQGCVEFMDYEHSRIEDALLTLNQFHCERWGMPCYGVESQHFVKNFSERLSEQEGQCVFQAMTINGEIVSIIFDVIWKGRRYNLQSGYAEKKFPKIALGAIHMGYAIQSAIENNQVYDFMAGTGKNSNYKERIATHIESLTSYSLERSYLLPLRKLQHLFSNKGI